MTTHPIAEVIGNRIDEMCVNKSKLAEKAGMDRTALWRKLNGDVKFTGDELVNLCVVLGLSIDDFIDEEEG